MKYLSASGVLNFFLLYIYNNIFVSVSNFKDIYLIRQRLKFRHKHTSPAYLDKSFMDRFKTIEYES